VQLSTEPDGGDLKKVLDAILKKDNPVGTSQNTSKNDRCRLMELYVFPGAIQHWNKALGALKRARYSTVQ
jgi:hypothetical protein